MGKSCGITHGAFGQQQGSTLRTNPWGQLAPKMSDLVASTNFLVAKKFSALWAELKC